MLDNWGSRPSSRISRLSIHGMSSPISSSAGKSLAGHSDRLDKGRMASEAREILDRLKISVPDMHAPVSQLSGGQRQAVAVCRAVTWGSKIVLMDEPTAALGVKESRKVLDLILRMKEMGTSVVIIVHNLEHVFSVADRIVVMRGGQVVCSLDRAQTNREEVVSLITGAI